MQIKANILPRGGTPAEPRFPEDDPAPPCKAPGPEPSPVEEAPKKKRIETSKLIVWVCLVNGFCWVWCSYLLAWFGWDLKTVMENLSKNNNWPGRFGDDETGGVG